MIWLQLMQVDVVASPKSINNINNQSSSLSPSSSSSSFSSSSSSSPSLSSSFRCCRHRRRGHRHRPYPYDRLLVVKAWEKCSFCNLFLPPEILFCSSIGQKFSCNQTNCGEFQPKANFSLSFVCCWKRNNSGSTSKDALFVILGQGSQLVDRGDTTYGGKWVVNPSGGLISKGHPLGATGIQIDFVYSALHFSLYS